MWSQFFLLIFVCHLWIQDVLQFLFCVVCKETQPSHLEIKLLLTCFWYLPSYLEEDFLVYCQLIILRKDPLCAVFWMFTSVLCYIDTDWIIYLCWKWFDEVITSACIFCNFTSFTVNVSDINFVATTTSFCSLFPADSSGLLFPPSFLQTVCVTLISYVSSSAVTWAGLQPENDCCCENIVGLFTWAHTHAYAVFSSNSVSVLTWNSIW